MNHKCVHALGALAVSAIVGTSVAYGAIRTSPSNTDYRDDRVNHLAYLWTGITVGLVSLSFLSDHLPR